MFSSNRLGLPSSFEFRLGLILSSLQGIFAVALLATSAWLISRAAEQPPVMYLMVAVVGVRGFALGRAAFRYGERILLHDSAFRMLAKVRPLVFKKLIPFSPAGTMNQSSGQVLSRVVQDVEELQNLPLKVISPLVQSLVVSILSVSLFSILLPSASIVLLATLSAAFLIAIPVSGAIAKQSAKDRSSVIGEIHENIIEVLENHDVLYSYGWLENRMKRIDALHNQLVKIKHRDSLSVGVGQALFIWLSNVAVIASTWLGAQAVFQHVQPGVNLALFALVPIALFDVVSLSQPVFASWRRYAKSEDRVREILNREIPAELKLEDGHLNLHSFEGIKFQNIDLKYPGGPDVVRSVSFELLPGETFLIRGASGSGKSTIAIAMARFLEPSSGQILLNGKRIQKFQIDSIRKKIGYIEQNPTIFMGTLEANLLIAKPSATEQEMLNVLQRVGLSQTFELRGGLKTEVGERGVLVSGGEAQRIAMARALLADFDLVILDEPTASLDRESADALMIDLLTAAKNRSNRAIVLISHDQELIPLADKVLDLG